jgi:hypothetical protein
VRVVRKATVGKSGEKQHFRFKTLFSSELQEASIALCTMTWETEGIRVWFSQCCLLFPLVCFPPCRESTVHLAWCRISLTRNLSIFFLMHYETPQKGGTGLSRRQTTLLLPRSDTYSHRFLGDPGCLSRPSTPSPGLSPSKIS